MKKIFILLSFVLLIAACGNDKNTPDVSDISVDVKVERFDEDFFKIDSNNLTPGIKRLQAKYPGFYNDYMQGILGVSGNENDQNTQVMTKVMLGNYASLYNSALLKLSAYTGFEKDLKKAFQFVKYYFPGYKVPGVITFLGTLDAPGMVLTDRYVAIGLHQYAGKNFEGYLSKQVMDIYPLYISRRFEPVYIPANCVKVVIGDLFPDRSSGKTLIEQIVEKGKQWWLLDKFMPSTADSLKTGYTRQQLDWCKQNEGLIWSWIVKNEDINTVSMNIIQNYIGDAPFTQNFSQELSPGNIGQWIGWQIVKKYAASNPNMKIEDVMKMNARKILDDAKYKPK